MVVPMPPYISLLEFTDDGIANIEESPDRLENAKSLAEEMECEVSAFYLTFGRYDAVTVLEALDDETAAEFILSVAKKGVVGSETLTAFTEDEYCDVIAGISG